MGKRKKEVNQEHQTAPMKIMIISIFLFLIVLFCHKIIPAFTMPKDYIDGGGFLSAKGKRYGTGVPYNMLNTSGKFVKQNSADYYYICKKGDQPGIYKVSTDGNASLHLTDRSASYMNIYRDSVTGIEWIYYIDDHTHALCRVNESGTVQEVLQNDCAYLFIIGDVLLYTTLDHQIYYVIISTAPGIDIDRTPSFVVETAYPVFGYVDYTLYYISRSDSGAFSISSLYFEHLSNRDPKVVLDHVPPVWYPYRSSILYIEQDTLYRAASPEPTEELAGTPANSKIYPTKHYICFEGEKSASEKNYPLFFIDLTYNRLIRILAIDHIPSELYLFDDALYQYDIEKGDLHRIYRLPTHFT